MSRKSNVIYLDRHQKRKVKAERVNRETLFTRAIGKAIEGLRRRQKLSQQFVAERLGLHQTAMCRIEKGAQHISLYQFVEFASLLRMPFMPILRAARKFVEAQEHAIWRRGRASVAQRRAANADQGNVVRLASRRSGAGRPGKRVAVGVPAARRKAA